MTTLANDPHTQGLYKASRIAQKAGIAVHSLPPGTASREIMDLIGRVDPDYIGLSYRLSPAVGVHELKRFIGVLSRNGLLRKASGRPRKIGFAGLPETVRAVEQSRGNLPCEVFTMPQDDDLLQRAARVLRFFDVSGSHGKAILEELKSELYPPTIPELDELAKEIVADDSYVAEPPLPIPSAAARRSLPERIRQSEMPILRAHFGIPDESIKPTVEGIARLAEARVLDEISLGSSDLSQRYFGRPEEFAHRKNDGGVPYNTFEDLVELAEAARRGNFPSLKPYSHVVDLVGFIGTCVRAGMLIGAHQAIPLYWFNELDGRGPMTVPESIHEHLAAVRELSRRGIPVEMNDPNQWSSRWAHDTIITADYGLVTAVMVDAGVRDLVLQMQFNKPRETGDLADLAKMTAGLQLADELLPARPDKPTIRRETRTGIGYLDPNSEYAKFQLARSTLLQMMVSSDIIHVVSYCEADHVATVEDVIDSSKLVRRCVRIFKQHQPDLLKYLDDPIVLQRREFLLDQSRFLLRRIAQIHSSNRAVDQGALRLLVPCFANAETLVEALRRGYMTAPGIFHRDYSAAGKITTGPTQNGFIDCLNPQTGLTMTEEARLALLNSG